MPYTPFHEKFLEIAEKETRAITAINDPELPRGTYSLLESYCDEVGCDCRRVFFHVYSEGRNEIVAVIAYGWEDSRFYADWFGRDNPEVIEELKGPILNSASSQSELAPVLLNMVKGFVLKDISYVERIKRHYRMFKDLIEKENRDKHNYSPTQPDDINKSH
ncbi:MAG: hypothetical protein EF813_04785 [Methanosarcinales archaeon]|nr:MAG: hypothetical protein EF813_04785 [Methanosarcinales archaeon]